jgi:rhamnosyltransferase subunit B
VHFLCSTFGSSGDVFPMMGLALELRRRGHDITFATNAHYGRVARQNGIPFEPLGTEADFAACLRDPDLWHPQRAFQHVVKSLHGALKQQYELHSRYAGSREVVALTNCFGFGALNAQDKGGPPVITLHLQPAVLWSNHEPPTLPGIVGPRWMKNLIYRIAVRFFVDPAVCPFLNSWRQELGLPPVKRVPQWWNSRFGVLCLFPQWFAAAQPDWPGNHMQADFPLWNHAADAPLSPDIEAFLGHGTPPIVFTPGSANVHGRAFFEAALHACRSLGRRGVLLTEFAEQVPPNLPETVAHFAYVPLDQLLPRSAAFVHHGGVGSMSQAMLAGIPQLLMPLAHDQFDNAARIRKLGLGDAIPARRFTGPRLTAGLQRLLESPSVASACRAAADRLARRDGLHRAADAIERHLARGVATRT